jgi:hypothetical protein
LEILRLALVEKEKLTVDAQPIARDITVITGLLGWNTRAPTLKRSTVAIAPGANAKRTRPCATKISAKEGRVMSGYSSVSLAATSKKNIRAHAICVNARPHA